MQVYDVLIIGGGPAGSTLAYGLRDSGLTVALMDKQHFPRHKVCAGWVSSEVMRLLDIDLQDYSQGRVLQKINGFRISLTGQQQRLSYFPGKPVSYGIRRIEFDDYLLQRCGATLMTGEALTSMTKTGVAGNETWLVNNKYHARLLVGAAGHFCPLARAMSVTGQHGPVVTAQEVEFKLSDRQLGACRLKAEIPELFFCQDLKGYGWVLRKGDYLNIGLGREDAGNLPHQVKKFRDYLASLGKIPVEITDRFNGHAYLLYPHAQREVVGDQLLLIGDSAGLAYAQSGEGIRPAVESAFLAADVILKSHNHYSKSNLQLYREQIEQRFGKRFPRRQWLKRIPRVIRELMARQLMKTNWFTTSIVVKRWFLQCQQPALPVVKQVK